MKLDRQQLISSIVSVSLCVVVSMVLDSILLRNGLIVYLGSSNWSFILTDVIDSIN